jgi:hypothetical protein
MAKQSELKTFIKKYLKPISKGFESKVLNDPILLAEFKMGVKVELEHTEYSEIAMHIALNHLEEFSNYYTYLDKMEKQMAKDKFKKEDTGY